MTFKEFWENTPIYKFVKRKTEENKFQQEVMSEARKEAMTEAKPEITKAIKEKYKQDIIDKATGKKKVNFFKELGINASNEKMEQLIGKQSNDNTNDKGQNVARKILGR